MQEEVAIPTWGTPEHPVEVILDPSPDTMAKAKAYRPLPNIPIKADVATSLNQNKLDSKQYNPTGAFAIMITALRRQDYNRLGQSWIGYVPNSRYQWMHKLLAQIPSRTSTERVLSNVDVEFASTFWMPSEEREEMLTWLRSYVSPGLKGFTVQPETQSLSRSGFKPVAKDDQLKMVYYQNPGLINLPVDPRLIERLKNAISISDYADLNNALHNFVLDQIKKTSSYPKSIDVENLLPFLETMLEDVAQESITRFDLESLSFLDKQLIDALEGLFEAIDDNKFTVAHLMKFINYVKVLSSAQQDLYIASLVNPWRTVGGKVPSNIPIPTSTYRLQAQTTISTNANGVAAFAMVPFTSENVDPFTFINVDVALTGTAANNGFDAARIIPQLPINVFDRIRLVSAGIKVSSILASDDNSGYMTLALCFDGATLGATVGSPDADLAKYGDFNLIDNLYYKQTQSLGDYTPLSLKWLPVDTATTEFVSSGVSSISLPYFIGYVTGAPASTAALRIEIIANCEAIVAPEFKDFVRADLPPPSMQALENTLAQIDKTQLFKDLPAETKALHGIMDPRILHNPLLTSNVKPEMKIPIGYRRKRTKKQTTWSKIKNFLSSLGKEAEPILKELTSAALEYGPELMMSMLPLI
jgi:hypothetical protein